MLTREDYNSITWASKEKIRNAKARFEIQLALDAKDKNKLFYNMSEVR